MDITELAAQQMARLASAREQNRERFPAAAELMDIVRAGGMDGSIVYAENAQGETIGRRDPGPWVDADLIVRAADWNDRALGRVRRDAA